MKKIIVLISMLLTFFSNQAVIAQWVNIGSLNEYAGQSHAKTVDPDGKIWVGKWAIQNHAIAPGDTVKGVYLLYVFNPDGTEAPFSPIWKILNDTMRNTTNRGMRTNIDGNILITTGTPALYLVDYKTGLGLKKATLVAAPTAPAVSSDGTIFIAPVVPGAFPISMYDQNLTLIGPAIEGATGFSRSFEVSKDGNTIYWAGYTNGKVYVYNRTDKFSAFALKDSIMQGAYCESFTWEPGTGYLWMAGGSANDKPDAGSGFTPGTWYAYDFTSNKVVDSIKWAIRDSANPQERPRGLAFSPDGKIAYIISFGLTDNPTLVQKVINNGVRIYFANESGSIGQKKEIPIFINNSSDAEIYSYEFEIKYDPQLVNISSAILEGTLADGFLSFRADSLTGTFRCAWATQTSLINSGKFLNLIVHLKKAGNALLNFSLFNLNNGNPYAITTNGVIEISNIPWYNNILVSDNGSKSQHLTFGVSPLATEGIDIELGEISLPPTPPGDIFDARFNLPGGSVYSLKDYRGVNQEEITWELSFQPGSGGYPITLSWDNTKFPDGSFYLKDIVTGTLINVNMKESSSYVLTNSGITSLKIKYLETVTKQIVLKSGWNMVSSPVDKSNLNVAQLFPNSQSNLFGFSEGYKVDTALVVTKGYWIKNSMDEIINIIGEQISGGINVKLGWNMIGIYDKNVSVQDLTTSPASIIQSDFFGFSDGYVLADSLKSGKGYWIKVSSNGQIELNTVLGKKNMDRLARTIDEEWVGVTVRDRNGRAKTVYIDKKQKAGEGYQLPPLPPSDIMDVRFIDQSYVAKGGKENQIEINGAEYPIEIIVNGSDVKIGDAIGMNGLNQILRAGEKLQITNEMINRIKITELEIPLNFELAQNYPNPFNPTTKIRFSLPENGRTKLTIYNSLGEKVETLVDEIKEAGYYEVEWNAKKYSSGVYFYNITTGNNHSVKKMLLVK